ncbi:calcineurin-like phosphoesterase [Lyophyllum atratum]|nr:calcineurin-like phosphoesterase [Lyophyllum atratum]
MVGHPQTHLAMLEPPVRQLCAYAVITLFVVFFFSKGLSYHFSSDDVHFLSTSPRFPDFSHYQDVQTLSADQFPLDDPNRRVIIVGDIHGMAKSLHKLLEKVSYNPTSDILVHVGDILTKGSHNSSMEVLSYMAARDVTGVRGNHDQKVIEWRAWITWIRSQRGGPRWLDDLSLLWAEAQANNEEPDVWVESEKRKTRDSKWWKKIPRGWKLFGDHFAVAQAMTEGQYQYLRALPLTIHVPSAHAYIVHAGILPSDPHYAHDHPRQPLARIPHLPKGVDKGLSPNETTLILRTLQERAVLSRVPQNTVPYNILNMRSVRHGKITKDTSGKAWSKVWKHDMNRCAGFNQELSVTKPKEQLLPCYPSTVVYGHAAGRGLDVKRWSIGLDTGCVYNRRLTALVLGPKALSSSRRWEDEDDEDKEEHKDLEDSASDDDVEASHRGVPFGDTHHGKIVSIACSQ